MPKLTRPTRWGRWITLMTLIAAMFGVAGHVVAKHPQPRLISDEASLPSPEPDSGGLHVQAPPSNDTCWAPAVLNLNRVTKISTVDATGDYQTLADPVCYSGIGQTPTTAPGRDVVLSFTAPSSGSYTFSVVQQNPGSDIQNQNVVLYVSTACPPAGLVSCLGGANRSSTRVFTTVTGTSNNQSEQVSCLPMLAGQTLYVFFDDGRAGNNGGPSSVEVRECITESEPNDSPSTANPMACGIKGSSHVAPAAHCRLGFRDGDVCTRSTPLDQSLPNSNARCSISGTACGWDTATGTDSCGSSEGHCEQLTDLDCDPHCTGGPNNTRACTTNAFCNPGSAQNATCSGTCQIDSTCIVTATGADTGISCTPICVGGSFNGRYCSTLSDCTGGGGTCNASAACAAGQTCGRQYNEGDVDFYSLGVVGSGSKIFAGLDAKAANDYDWRMRITSTTNTLQFDDDDGVSRNGSAAPQIAGAPGAGTDTFIKISRTVPRASEPYLLYSIVQGVYPGQAQLEDEAGPVGNDIYFGWPGDVLSANYINNTSGGNHGYIRGLFNGTHGGFTYDSDCFKFIVNEGDLMSWYGDGEPARSMFANTQFPHPIIYDAEPAGISNFIFGANARKNIGTCAGGTNAGASCTSNAGCDGGGSCDLIAGHPSLNALAPAVTTSFFQWRASYTGMLEVCYYDAAAPLGLGTPGSGNWAGSLDVNCGPLQAAGPGATTTDVSVEKTIFSGDGQTGTFLTYQIVVTNSSADIAQEVRLHDVLDPNLSFINLTVDDGLLGNNTTCITTDGFAFLLGLPSYGTADMPIDCINTSMAPGAVTTYLLTVQVNNCIGAGANITNTATITTVSTDPDPSNDASSVMFMTTEDGTCQALQCDYTGCATDLCNGNGTCSAGMCVTEPVDCDDNDACTEDSCDPFSGCINYYPIENICIDYHDCTMDRCNPVTGICEFPTVPSGTPCDDGLACTPDDGTCDGNGNCVNPFCDDGNDCTDNFISESCVCSYANSFPGAPCDDGNACTGGTSGTPDYCDGAGTCVGGDPPNADDGNACTTDYCDPETGAVNEPIDCDDGNECTFDSCDPAAGCVYTPHDNPCDDGNACTGSAEAPDTCDGNGVCVGGAPPNCDDANACTADVCDPENGCVNTAIDCDDGNGCTIDECHPLIGCDYRPATCHDFDPCDGVEYCNPKRGCEVGPPLDCDDRNACNGVEICSSTVRGCVAGTPLMCDDGNPCNGYETCDPATGCVPGMLPTFCDDGNACNGVEYCNPPTGCVAGTPVVCAAPGQCQTAGVCIPPSGTCSYGSQPNGTTCDDGNPATSADTCQNGTCVGESGCTSTHNPRTVGFWRKVCRRGTFRGETISDADAACVNALSDTFSTTTRAQVCNVLDGDHDHHDDYRRSSCSKAEDQLMALALNLCKERVCCDDGIDSRCDNDGHEDDLSFNHNHHGDDDDDDGHHDGDDDDDDDPDHGGSSTVCASFNTADGLLDDPSRTNSGCRIAECLSKEINNGHSLEFATLVVRREGGNVRLAWLSPVLNDGTARPESYRIWRREARSEAPFVHIGSTMSTEFLDVTGGTGSWEYDVTAVLPDEEGDE